MSISINNLTFTGRVGSVFGIKKYNSGSLLEFSVAVRSNFKNRNGEYDTQWYRCKVWDKQECSYINVLSSQLAKGSSVTCSGQLEFDPATGGPRLFTGSDGVWRSVFSVVCRDVVVQSPKPGGYSEGKKTQEDSSASYAEEDVPGVSDDIPW